MDYYKNVYRAYFIMFFHNLIPAYVIERLFWQERGMSVFEVVLCEIIYAITIVLIEIPTGVLADRFGRKTLLVFGAVLSMLEFVILLFAHQFWAFAIVVFLAGIAGACTSGAFNALLYDSLLAVKREKSFEKIIGRCNSLDFVGALLAALAGSLLAKWLGFEFNYIFSAISMGAAFCFTIFLKEPPIEISNDGVQIKTGQLKEYVKSSFTFYRNNPKIMVLITNAMAIGACVNYLDEFWQLYLDGIGFSIMYFGVFSAVISLSRIPGNLLAETLINHLKVDTIILIVLGISSFGFFMTAIYPGWIGIVAMIVVFIASGAVDPVVTGYLHHHSDSNIRATIESVQSLIERAIMFIVGIGFGLISSKVSLMTGFLFLAVVTFMFFLVFFRKQKTSE